MKRTAIGTHRHQVRVQNPDPSVPPVSDGDGGFVQPYVDASPATWYCAIEPATARTLERVTAGTHLSTATHIITGRYNPAITDETRIVFKGRAFYVSVAIDPEERHIETIAVAIERLGATLLVDATLAQDDLFQDGLAQEGLA